MGFVQRVVCNYFIKVNNASIDFCKRVKETVETTGDKYEVFLKIIETESVVIKKEINNELKIDFV